MVRDTGDANSVPVVYFHGTPGSRLESRFGDEISRQVGARVISFDRPGYGRSDAASSSLGLVVSDVEAIADEIGLGRFAVFGWSGGGPFALATAAALGGRVTRVGVSGGIAPAQEMPGARDSLTDNDLEALSYLPDQPVRAAEQFGAGNRALLDAMVAVRDDEQAPWIDWLWAASDPEVVVDPGARRALFVSLRESLRQGPTGINWDNVAFVGPWGFDLGDVRSRVHLWYGGRDQMVPSAHGEWLAGELPDAELVCFRDEGHLLPLRHWKEMVQAVTTRG